jgi:nitrogen fixation/metabolism regulation signal transduction histidine kinase
MSQEQWYVATGVSACVIVLLVIELFRFIDRTNREFLNLLESMKYQDFSKSYTGRFSEQTFKQLESSYNEILSLYRNAKMDKEIQFQYLQMVIDHVQLALICFSREGRIILFNNAAGKLFQRPQPENIESLGAVYPDLYKLMQKLDAGQRDLVKVYREGELLQLAVMATEFRLKEERYKLVSIQDIKQELEEQELDSWQKLIRVLTHEIMNSVTPVSSLSSAVNEMLVDDQGRKRRISGLDEDDLEDMYSSLGTIEERSRGLLKFVGDYKNLTRLPKPHFEDLDVKELTSHIQQLLKKDMDRQHIRFILVNPSQELKIWADRQMIQQVLINLVKNAMEALAGRKEKKIKISAFRQSNKTFIRVYDNGPGIDTESADKVFIPFFTTRKKGSGIGLSLSKQIMRLHKGSISFQSDSNGTTFTLEF